MMNEREWKVVRDTTFNRGRKRKNSAMKVPRQYPLVLLVEEKVRRGERAVIRSETNGRS
jgi:hypothetical protein